MTGWVTAELGYAAVIGASAIPSSVGQSAWAYKLNEQSRRSGPVSCARPRAPTGDPNLTNLTYR